MMTRNGPRVRGRFLRGRGVIRGVVAGVSAVAVASGLLLGLGTSPAAAAASGSDFDPGMIIADSVFYDGAAMTSAEIQSFLDFRGVACRNENCLARLTVSVPDQPARISSTTGRLICSAFPGGYMRVSELLYRTQVACGISAKVILVTMQKEQSLVTTTAPSDTALRHAMGMACPDSAPCNTAYEGLVTQIIEGTRQLKAYKAANFARQPGVHYIAYNPNPACGGADLAIRNYATAALYN
jgi:hypothetical protein